MRTKLKGGDYFNSSPPASDTIRTKIFPIIIGFLIIIMGHWVGSMIRGNLHRKAQREWQANSNSTSKLSYVVLGTFFYWLSLGVSFIIVLRLLGVEIAGIIAVIGTMGFAAGLALQGVLSDAASGVSLSFSNAFTIGDVIEVDGRQGVVRNFTLMTTIVEDIDTKAILTIPNRTIMDGIFINHTKQPVRWINFDIMLSNDNKDFKRIIEVIKAVATQEPKILREPAPMINVVGMNAYGTSMNVKFAISSKDYPYIIPSVMTRVRQALSDSNINLLDIKQTPVTARK